MRSSVSKPSAKWCAEKFGGATQPSKQNSATGWIVEHGVTAQPEKTLERLASINSQQKDQQRAVETIQGEQYAMTTRLQMLEQKVQVMQSARGFSTADTDFGGESQPSSWEAGGTTPRLRRRSTRSGKWSRTSASTSTQSKHSCQESEGDTQSCRTSPGKGKTSRGCGSAFSVALKRVRHANIQTGTHDDGKAKYLWLQLSQSPEKRLCLTLGATLAQVETEWPTGTVWLRGTP